MSSLRVFVAAALIVLGAGCGGNVANPRQAHPAPTPGQASAALLLPDSPGDLHLEQLVTSEAEQDPVTAYAEGATLGVRTLAVLVTASEDWEQPYGGKPVKLDKHEATMGGSGQHRWITWPVRSSEDFESFAVLGHGLSEAELIRAANGVAEDLRRPRIDAAHLPQGLDLVKTGSLPIGNWQAELGGTEQVWTNRRARARLSVSQLPGDAGMGILAGATVSGEPREIRGTTGLAGGDLLSSGSLRMDWVHEDPALMMPKVRLWRENGIIVKVSALGLADEVVDAFVRDLRPAGPEAVERARDQILEYPPDLLFPPTDDQNRPLRVVTHGRNAERAWAMSAGLQGRTFTWDFRVLSRRAEIVDGGGGSFEPWKPEYGRVPLMIMRDVMELGLPSDNVLVGFAGTGVRKVRISYSDGTSAGLPLGPVGPGGVRWFSAEVRSRSFKLSAEMKDGKVTDSVRRLP
ncbi:hypothetical protein EDD27_7632 [Nonomuraea polychroma]|uniref:Uncharacterized protein n=1 Tax=Nonomuraea polychroma TaxID=46176 RepID=A0A438MGF7_9ACTN|nr:hypothetical protein [Nonomuraea polychroma]RVX44873.1 hypothetical protein EDD27_7632 [Nonomuraea polychroma]